MCYWFSSTNILSASLTRRLRLYPDTDIEIGSPRGAICSTFTYSPGTQPISINFRNRSLFSKDNILAVLPAFNSDNLFILKQVTNVALPEPYSLRFLEMPQNLGSKIQLRFLVQSFNLKERTRLKSFLFSLLKKQGRPVDSLTIIFCSDKYLLDLNKSFLAHDYYTDIITFYLSESKLLTAEIYISVDRVQDNALRFEKSLKEELHRVIFHGALHLCGYKDKTLRDQKKMRAMEDQALSAYFKP